ncbi:penicillin-binding transpeptidase domain-containing protein [Nonomuraea sp. NPDC005501]|uniref:penicillin-binding transpeptidase domain-containing protein n=1 Tax=Nonomuraea sp. NPDC005501 TaxID=3156884 RepID=UPI0033BBA83B
MAGSRARRIDIPLRRVSLACAAMLFVLLADLTLLQAFGRYDLEADPRNAWALLARFGHPRGDILTHEGAVVATSRRADGGPYDHLRVYDHGEMYAHVTGYASLQRATGVEGASDAVLSGSDPKVRVRTLVEDHAYGGADVRLTIRGRVQRAAYEALKATGRPGAAVALDPETGAVLALASYPSYDPGVYIPGDPRATAAADRRLRADPRRPLLNRALDRTYPPGSVFELVTTAAALGSGEYTVISRVGAPARLALPGPPAYLTASAGRPCGDGRPSLAYAFQLSCDTALANLGLQLGPDLLRDQAEAFGFNADDLSVPLPARTGTYPGDLDQSRAALSAIGRDEVRATPLMLAMLSAAVANGGLLMRPYLVEEVRLPDGSVTDRAEPAPYRTVMPSLPAGQLAAMMTTTTVPGGPAAGVALPGMEVAAKTTTGPGPGPSACTAFAPADAPQVAVGVVLEDASPSAAAPLARTILKAALS